MPQAVEGEAEDEVGDAPLAFEVTWEEESGQVDAAAMAAETPNPRQLVVPASATGAEFHV